MRLPLLPVLLLWAAPAVAEVELGFSGGWAGTSGGGAELDGGTQAGVRTTLWGGADLGVTLDYSRLDGAEGSDGLSFGTLESLTVGGVRRWDDAFDAVTPYLGAGFGVARAELGAGGDTAEATGPALSWVAGASVPIGGNWSVFGEYEGTYADVEGDAEGGGTLEAETVTNSINLGVSFSF